MGVEWSAPAYPLNVAGVVAAVEDSDSAAAALQSFIHVLRNVGIAKYTLVATFALFVYDILLTLDEEVALVWPSRFGAPKAFFFLNRYFPFFDLALLVYVLMAGSDPVLCVALFQTLGGFVAFGFVMAQLILAMRTWAIWGRRKSVTILLATMLIGALGVDIYVLHRYLNAISYSPLGPFEPAFQGCPLHFANRFVFVDFALVMVTESIMLVLLVVKAFEHFKHSRSTLMVRMFKDGVIYFVFILITSITNLAVILTAPVELHNFLIITQRILHSVLCSRVLLHIRGAYTNTAYASTTNDSHIQSGPSYVFRRPISAADDFGPRGPSVAMGPGASRGRGGRRGRDSFELTSVDVHDHTYDDRYLTSTRGDSSRMVRGWGMGDGYAANLGLDVEPDGKYPSAWEEDANGRINGRF